MLVLHEIDGALDPELIPFTRLLQTLFPPEEQVLASEVIELAQEKSRGGAVDHHFLTVRDPEEPETLAMAWYTLHAVAPEGDPGGGEIPAGAGPPSEEPKVNVAWLWYIGIDSRHQSKGYGSRLYREICRRAFEDHGCQVMVLEVERVDVASRHSAERAVDARRRLRFYLERCGAQRLEGIQYLQETGWQPGVPMHLLVQWPDPDRPCFPPEALFRLLQSLFGDQLRGVEGVAPSLVGPADE